MPLPSPSPFSWASSAPCVPAGSCPSSFLWLCRGVPLPPLLALLATSPLMSPDALTITWAGLGPALAWTKIISAAGMGFLVGGVTYVLEKRSNFSNDIVKIKPVFEEDGSLASAYDIACANEMTVPTMVVRPRDSKLLFFLDRARDTSWFVGKFLLLAVALQVVLELAVPMDAIRFIAGDSGVTSLLWAAILGAPLPAHQVSVVPIIRGLLDLGMDPAAAATFLVAGPVTSIPALLVLWKVFERRLFFMYLGLCLLGAVATGLIYRLVV